MREPLSLAEDRGYEDREEPENRIEIGEWRQALERVDAERPPPPRATASTD